MSIRLPYDVKHTLHKELAMHEKRIMKTYLRELLAAEPAKLGWCSALAGQEAVNRTGCGVAWPVIVDQQHLSTGTAEHQRCAQAGGTATDDGDAMRMLGERWHAGDWRAADKEDRHCSRDQGQQDRCKGCLTCQFDCPTM